MLVRISAEHEDIVVNPRRIVKGSKAPCGWQKGMMDQKGGGHGGLRTRDLSTNTTVWDVVRVVAQAKLLPARRWSSG